MSAQQMVPCFLHSQHAHLPLPRRRLDDRTFEVEAGRARLCIEAGTVFKNGKFKKVPLPYGRYARLALIFINTAALQTKSKEIVLGSSIKAFVRTLIGREPNGCDIKNFRVQFEALIAAALKLGFRSEAGEEVLIQMHLAKTIARTDCGRGEKIVVALTDEYFEHLLKHALPLPIESVSKLSSKPLALDIYCWLVARLHTIRNKDGQFVGWVALQSQFGCTYSQVRDFRRDFLKALEVAQAEYHGTKIENVIMEVDGGQNIPRGIRLFESPPPIAAKKKEIK